MRHWKISNVFLFFLFDIFFKICYTIFVIGEKIDRKFDIFIASLCTLLVLVLIIYAKKCNFKLISPVKEKLLEDSNKNIILQEPIEEPVKEEPPVVEENDSTIEANIDNYLIDKETKKEEPKPVVVEENKYADLASDIVEISDDGEAKEEITEAPNNTVEVDIPDVMISEELDRMIREYSENLKMQGITLEQFYQLTTNTLEI